MSLADLVTPAARIAERVRAGELTPVDAVRASLDRIAELDGRIHAFRLVRRERALAEAEALGSRPDLDRLPLAGVPMAVKDNLAVAGEPTRMGSGATPGATAPEDHETVRRLREAGAVVVGKTTLPELGIWATTESELGITRNPWDPSRTAGGSSGGSAAAVGAGMVPIALGNDALGSIRIPAAACGVFGIKPGADLVPSAIGPSSWFGLAENGPLATTVEDGALILALLAGRSELARTAAPDRPLRIAVSARSPLLGVRVDPEYAAAAAEAGRVLAGAGHAVEPDGPPQPAVAAVAVLARWFAGVAEQADALDTRALQRRTRGHARMGRIARRLRLVRSVDRDRWRRRLEPFFRRHDLLVTPALATIPVPAHPWHERGWLANITGNARYAPFAAPWNLAGYPAAAIPFGLHSSGLPLSIQLVAPAGGEALVLAVARQLETARPWSRQPPADTFRATS